jgi:D-alanyl-lipoteichoic acid acyltransferase DltB (MBOAT superfamily)
MAAGIYRFLPHRWKNPWLVLISAGFLMTWSWKFILILVIFGYVNFALGKKIDPHSPSRRKWVWGGIVFNLFILFIFKYSQFFLPEFEKMLQSIGILQPGVALQILLPIGLSFLVIQVISYLLDVSNKRLEAETNPMKFGVYILYFPKLISGPVENARQFLPRLDSPLPFDRSLVERSLALLLSGLFRKLVFANPLFNLIPPDTFLNPLNYNGQVLLLYLLAYAFALYNDFAGYTLIVRGVSLWFGIELTNNFNLPYLSRSFTEFWTRWHISLTSWLRDYIYFPLSRALIKRFPQRNHFLNFVLPPIVTMLISGLWHGLSWNLLVWGGLYGLYLVIERIPSLWHNSIPLDDQPRWQQILGTVRTFLLVTLAWIPFRMELPAAASYLKGLFLWQKPDFFLFKQFLLGKARIDFWSVARLPDYVWILILVLVGAIVLDVLQKFGKGEEFLLRWSRVGQIIFILILLIAGFFAVFSDNTAPFVYQTF